jgi:hypothetical protein
LRAVRHGEFSPLMHAVLYQGDKLDAQADRAYRNALRESLLGHLALSLESALRTAPSRDVLEAYVGLHGTPTPSISSRRRCASGACPSRHAPISPPTCGSRSPINRSRCRGRGTKRSSSSRAASSAREERHDRLRHQRARGFAVGWYGKIPGTGDFIARRVPASFREPWDRWLQGAIDGSKQRLGARWRDAFLSMPAVALRARAGRDRRQLLGGADGAERRRRGALLPARRGVRAAVGEP